jgi:hypothetical protein
LILEPWWSETAELVHMAKDQRIERYEDDPWEEVIGPWPEARSTTSISEVLERCLQKPQVDPNGQEPRRPMPAFARVGTLL